MSLREALEGSGVLRQPSCGAAQALVICAQHVPSRQRNDSGRCVRVWESRQGPRRVAPSGWQEAGAGTRRVCTQLGLGVHLRVEIPGGACLEAHMVAVVFMPA